MSKVLQNLQTHVSTNSYGAPLCLGLGISFLPRDNILSSYFPPRKHMGWHGMMEVLCLGKAEIEGQWWRRFCFSWGLTLSGHAVVMHLWLQGTGLLRRHSGQSGHRFPRHVCSHCVAMSAIDLTCQALEAALGYKPYPSSHGSACAQAPSATWRQARSSAPPHQSPV